MISINDFNFEWCGYGHYKVTYTSPKTWKKWTCVTNDMRLIDSTKNEGGFAKKSDLNSLKLIVKNQHMKSWAEIRESINLKQVIEIGDITIDVRNESVLYVTIGDWVVYIDDSTNEKIISTWKN